MNLSTEQLQGLQPADRDRYMELERLFASKGWLIVQAMAKANADVALNVGANASTWADNRVAYGNRIAWLAVANMEEATETVYEQKVAQAHQAAEIVRIADESEYE